MDVRKRQGQVVVDADDPGRILRVYHLHLHRKREDRLQHPVDSRIYNRRGLCRCLRRDRRLVRQKAQHRNAESVSRAAKAEYLVSRPPALPEVL